MDLGLYENKCLADDVGVVMTWQIFTFKNFRLLFSKSNVRLLIPLTTYILSY